MKPTYSHQKPMKRLRLWVKGKYHRDPSIVLDKDTKQRIQNSIAAIRSHIERERDEM